MEASHLREINHIVVNFTTRKKTTGYRINSRSETSNTLFDLLRRKLIEYVNTRGLFYFLRPKSHFLTKLSAEEIQQLENFKN